MKPVPIVIMLPPTGPSRSEQWVAEGRRAAARDLIHRLAKLESAGSILILAAQKSDRDDLTRIPSIEVERSPVPFHFGRVLANIVRERGFQRVAYFGGGSAPLMSEEQLRDAFDCIADTDDPTAVVNNYHSTDWVVINHARYLLELSDRLPTDNPIGWVLDHDTDCRVHSQEPSAATRSDIDTPTDLLLIRWHPSLGPELSDFLNRAPWQVSTRIELLREVMQTEAKTLTLIGRASSHLWRTLEGRTQIWIRAFVEERGMVASGRVSRGEVTSLLGKIVDEWGPHTFVKQLSSISDAALWDTRVWMAHRGAWPSTADRFAADLGLTDEVSDIALHDLTEAINQAPIPIIAGGHGVVAGGLYALLETLCERY